MENKQLSKEENIQEKFILTGSLLTTFLHDLKNPLMTIKGLSQLGEYRSEALPVKEYFQKINKKSDEILLMINHVFIDSNKQELTESDPDILINEVIQDLQPSCHLQNISLAYNNENNRKIKLEKNLFKRAIYNLIKNSVEAVHQQEEKGKINLRVRNKNDEYLEIKIKDNGPGIPEKQQQDISQPFIESKEGAGLGLYMVYYTVKKIHNGRISFTSKPRQGTTFLIELPYEQT